MIFIVAGGRDFADAERLNAVLDWFATGTMTAVMQGGAKGADKLAADWAKRNELIVEHLPRPADWDKYQVPAGKKNPAGVIRNQQMAQEADALIAFWDGRSPGTKDMIEKATRANLEVHIYRY